MGGELGNEYQEAIKPRNVWELAKDSRLKMDRKARSPQETGIKMQESKALVRP